MVNILAKIKTSFLFTHRHVAFLVLLRRLVISALENSPAKQAQTSLRRNHYARKTASAALNVCVLKRKLVFYRRKFIHRTGD